MKTYTCMICGYVEIYSCIDLGPVRMCWNCYDKLKGGSNGLFDLSETKRIAGTQDLHLYRPRVPSLEEWALLFQNKYGKKD